MADVDDEVAFHLAMRELEARRAGMNDGDARDSARRRFGDVGEIASELHEMDRRRVRRRRRAEWWSELRQDVRVGLRSLRRSPSFALTAIATIAIAIAANTTVFSFVDALLFERLPYANADQLVVIRKGVVGLLGEALALRDRARSLSDLAVYRQRSITLNDGDAVRLDGAMVTSNMFNVLGVTPRIGSGFSANANDPGNDHVIVLSHGLWTRRYGADRNILGRVLNVDGQPFTVVGVMSPDFRFPTSLAEFWVPITIDRGNLPGIWATGGGWYVGRLRNGILRETAQHELRQTLAGMRRLNPLWDPGADYGTALELVPFRQHLVGGVQSAALLLWTCAGVVLLVACVNLANLLLARASARENELAVRAALGAGRGRLVRQLLAESLVIAMLGGIVSIGLAAIGTRWIAAAAPLDFPHLGDTGMRGSVYLFSIVLTVCSTLTFGLLPALRATAPVGTSRAIRGSRPGRLSIEHQRVAAALIIAEVAVAVVLTIAGGVLARSFIAIRDLSPGFRIDHIVVAQMNPPARSFAADNARTLALYDAILQRVATLPGVVKVAAADRLPIANPVYGMGLRIEGKYEDIRHQLPWIPHFQAVTPGYLETFGIPLLRGRSFTSTDDDSGQPVAIVSQSLAKTYWPGEDAVGKRIGSPYPSPWMTIVGVVPDVRLDSLRDTSGVALYVPIAQRFSGRFGAAASASLGIAVRTAGDPSTVEQMIRGLIQSVDRSVAVSRVRTMDRIVDASVAKPRFTAYLVGAFAVVTLLLGAVGIYGVMSYLVSQRTHEIGIRAALGATSRDIAFLVFRRSLLLTCLGAGVGFIGASFATRALPALLFRVSPLDPLTFGLVPVVFVAIGLLASIVPARHAMRCDPIRALRGD
jgi:putative ABC transport system permease protein